MGYDLYPMDTLAAKQRFVQEAVNRETLVFFEHDAAVSAAYLRRRGTEVVVEPVEGK
jgi:hypothetical protein